MLDAPKILVQLTAVIGERWAAWEAAREAAVGSKE